MGTTGISQNSYTLDASDQLKDAGLVAADAAATVAAAARVLDFGNVTPQGVVQVSYVPGHFVVDVSANEVATGDEEYYILYQLSDDASANGVGFDAGDLIVVKACIPLGNLTNGVFNAVANDDLVGLGRTVIAVDNEFQGTLFQFARAATIVIGTIATGINYTAFLSRLSSW